MKFGQGDDYVDTVSRYEQFLFRRLRDFGDYKGALAIINKQLGAFANQSQGRLFNLYLVMANYLLAVRRRQSR